MGWCVFVCAEVLWGRCDARESLGARARLSRAAERLAHKFEGCFLWALYAELSLKAVLADSDTLSVFYL